MKRHLILLCDLYNVDSVTRSEYVNFLEKNLVKDNEIYEIEKNTSVFCYRPNLLGAPKPADEAIIETARKLLKKNGLIINRDCLDGSAAETIQNLLIKRYPCD